MMAILTLRNPRVSAFQEACDEHLPAAPGQMSRKQKQEAAEEGLGSGDPGETSKRDFRWMSNGVKQKHVFEELLSKVQTWLLDVISDM